jgi:2-dehydro-3-deoxyphosphogluconate aldolase / (4S)-4-hydroxy-2-oxoglutarate aldolase
MARFKRLQVFNTMIETGMVPLFYHQDAEIVKKAVKACYDGGARIFEFTNRGDFAHEVFAGINKWAAKECPDMILGVGSVVDAGTCSLYIQLGANFIVSPLLNPDMAGVCNRRKIGWVPGCATVSEINRAEELGAEIVKIFPGKQLGGPGFVKSLLGPCPWSLIMPSGGATPEYDVLKEWFDAGAACVGLGSALFPKKAVNEGNFNEIENKVRFVIESIQKIKK